MSQSISPKEYVSANFGEVILAIEVKAIFTNIDNLAATHEIVSVEGSTKVERYLNIIHMGDWVSFWCAILHKTNPTPVIKIDKLKEILSKKS